jgi:hypothetical protein
MIFACEKKYFDLLKNEYYIYVDSNVECGIAHIAYI